MALATRCPHCQAMFRVVSDQLKLRGGLVRCGNCRAVFDAIGSLSYIDETTLSVAASAAASAAAPQAADAVRAAPVPSASAPLAARSVDPGPERDARSDAGAAARSERGAAPTGKSSSTRPSVEVTDATAERPRLPEAVGARGATSSHPVTPTPPVPIDPLAVPTLLASKGERVDDAPVEEIVVHPVPAPPGDVQAELDAERGAPAAARHRKGEAQLPLAVGTDAVTAGAARDAPADEQPDEIDAAAFLRESRPKRGFSIVYGGGSLLLALAMLLQLAIVFRTELLIQWPELRPRLAALCELYGCTVGWPTRAEQLAVIGTELQAVPGTDILELTAVVRNRAPFRMSLPAIEVTLTDTTNRTLARKVFAPVDYLASGGEPSSRLEHHAHHEVAARTDAFHADLWLDRL